MRYRSGLRHWHPLLASRELGERPLCRQLCGESLVLFRTATGQAAAVGEVCPHRRMSLAAASVQGEELVCAYHGWRFAADGRIGCPLMPNAGLEHLALQVREAHGLVWVRESGPGERAHQQPDLPRWPSTDLVPAGVVFHRVPAPLELTLDNFTETEHTTTIHEVFGFTDPREVELRLELEPRSTRVWNSGPQKRFPPLFNAFIDMRPGDHFANDWLTTFDPPLTVYEQTWRRPTGALRRFRLRVVMFFLPLDDATTQLTTLLYTQRVLPGVWHDWLAAPVIRWLTGHELNLDVLALARLADPNPELNPRTLGPFDRVLLENRRRLRSIYLAE